MRLYRSGNLGLGSSVKDLADELQAHLLAANWLVHDDTLLSQGDASGSRIYALPNKGDSNGLVKLEYSGTDVKFSAVHRFENGVADYESEQYSRDIDLANGSNYFLSVDEEHLAIFFETPAAISKIVVVGVVEPDTVSPVYAGQNLDAPRGFVADPVENEFSVAQYAVASGVSRFAETWALVAGNKIASRFDVEFRLAFEYGERSNDLIDYNPIYGERYGILNAVYQPTGSLSNIDLSSSASQSTLQPFVAWAALPGVYLTTADAGDRVALLIENRDGLYGDINPLSLASDLSDSAASLELIGDLSDLAPAGSVHISDEWIEYAAVSGQTLSGLVRGRFGSKAKAHTANLAPYADAFDRADTDNDLGADYTLSGVSTQTKIDVLSNQVEIYKDTGNSYRYPVAVLDTLSAADMSVAADIDFSELSGSTNNEVHLYLRYIDADNFYRAELREDGNAKVIAQLNGTETSINTSDIDRDLTSGRLEFDIKGDRLRLLLDGRVISGGISTKLQAPGKAGFGAQLYSSNAKMILDNLEIARAPQRLSVYRGQWFVKTGKAAIDAGAVRP